MIGRQLPRNRAGIPAGRQPTINQIAHQSHGSGRHFGGNQAQKRLAKTTGSAMFKDINARPDDNRESPMANARRPLASAADFTRGGGPPAPDHDADNTSRASRVGAEQRRLIQWAQENGKLGVSGRLPPVFARGGEHQVYFQKRTRRYIKATLPDRQKGYGIALGSLTRERHPGRVS